MDWQNYYVYYTTVGFLRIESGRTAQYIQTIIDPKVRNIIVH